VHKNYAVVHPTLPVVLHPAHVPSAAQTPVAQVPAVVSSPITAVAVAASLEHPHPAVLETQKMFTTGSAVAHVVFPAA